MLDQGGLGVGFFFVLSGFVLTWSRRADDTPRRFYRRRFARIFPNYLVAWCLGGAVALQLGLGLHVGVVLPTLFLVQAWTPDLTTALGMDGVSWSLSCEAFFYAVFPLLIFLLLRARPVVRRGALAAVTAGIFAMPFISNDLFPKVNPLWLVYLLPPVRLLEFAAGVIVALEVREGRWPRFPAWATLVFAGAVYFVDGIRNPLTPYSGDPAVTFIPFLLLIAAFAQHDVAGKSSFLSSRWAVRLGEWSYAFYLLHFLVIVSILHAIGGPPSSTASALAWALLVLIAAVAASAALYTLVERPAERRLRGSLRAPTRALERTAPHQPVSAK